MMELYNLILLLFILFIVLEVVQYLVNSVLLFHLILF